MRGYICLNTSGEPPSLHDTYPATPRSHGQARSSEATTYTAGAGSSTLTHEQDLKTEKSLTLCSENAGTGCSTSKRTIHDLPPEVIGMINDELAHSSDNGELDVLALALSHPRFYDLLKKNYPAPIRVFNLWDDEHPDFLSAWMGSQYRVTYQPTALYLERSVYGDVPGFAQWELHERRADYIELCMLLAMRFPDCTVPRVYNQGNAWYYEAYCLYNAGRWIGRDWERCWAGSTMMQRCNAFFALAALEEWIVMVGF
ncbi:hypothetical protein PVAG01_08540 [Phlyctema vagabunda]|uniref:Uncharacterized protein n=1 Tax=Phlyctema vagabunda TaxID=108571 RepID=A0ABR4P9P4_9HELO